MIKVFVTDIDGCLTRPFEAPDWDVLTIIRGLNQKSRQQESYPPLTICSGRPLPYVEAVAQWLDIDLPIIFENAGLYSLKTNKLTINHFNDQAQEEAGKLKSWLFEHILADYPGAIFEFSKKTDIGFIHPEKKIIDEIYPIVKNYVGEYSTLFEVHKTDISINIILQTNNKKEGIVSLAEELEIDVSEMAFIGDASGDVEALNLVGYPFAPLNAIEEIKDIPGIHLLDSKYTEAVLEAYYLIGETNIKERMNVPS